VFCEKAAHPDILQMCEVQFIVYGALFPNLSHAAKILRPTSHWEKQITQTVEYHFFIRYCYFSNTKLLLHIFF